MLSITAKRRLRVSPAGKESYPSKGAWSPPSNCSKIGSSVPAHERKENCNVRITTISNAGHSEQIQSEAPREKEKREFEREFPLVFSRLNRTRSSFLGNFSTRNYISFQFLYYYIAEVSVFGRSTL